MLIVDCFNLRNIIIYSFSFSVKSTFNELFIILSLVVGRNMNVTTTESSVSDQLTSLAGTVFATPETLILSSVHENGSYHDHVKDSHKGPSSESLAFVLIPLIVVLTVAIVSGMAIYCIQRRQRLDSLRHTLIPLYRFTPADDDEWGVLLDNAHPNPNQEGDRFR
ncbi:unnamed protein product [Orchesella dallaii]|uniref:Small integral membrane protein 29 n=1 Tax=Orchesella dallaii TaxID=48710 RepID=A0ABP1Q8B7_9HEXA